MSITYDKSKLKAKADEFCRLNNTTLDNSPDHMVRDEIWHEQKSEEFGDNWEEAQAVIREIEYRADLWLADVNTGNIKFKK